MNKSTEVSGLSVLVFRILLSGIFISAGITHHFLQILIFWVSYQVMHYSLAGLHS